MADHNGLPSSNTSLLMHIPPNLHKFQETGADDPQQASHKREHSLYQQWRPAFTEVVQEIKQLYTIAIPMIITGLLIYGKSAISMHFMGRLGKEALAGGTLSVGIANIAGFSIILGLSMGMEAISSQAFGAKQWAIMAQTLYRTTAILLLTSIPISLLWLNINPILLLCGQDPTISSIASTYLAFSIPDLFFQSFIHPLKIYLRTQNITRPLIFSAAFSLSIHHPINYFLVHSLHLGIRGIAMASAIANLNILISLSLYIRFFSTSDSIRSAEKSWELITSITCFDDCKMLLKQALPSCVTVCLEWWWYELMIVFAGDTIANLNILISLSLHIRFFSTSDSIRSAKKSWELIITSITCFDDCKMLLKQSLPSCVTVCLEWWWYELMIVFAGLLPDASEVVAAMGILIQATSLVYIFPSALSQAASTRVGNELGANQPGKAKASSRIALFCAVSNGFIAMLFMMTVKNAWGGFFTIESGVLAASAAAMPVVALCELGNCPQTVGCGVLRGSARPTSGANINLGSFYGVGLPVAIVMGLVMGMGLRGLWLGLLAAQVVCAVLMVFMLMRTDWIQEANRGRKLIGINEKDQEAQEKTQG